MSGPARPALTPTPGFRIRPWPETVSEKRRNFSFSHIYTKKKYHKGWFTYHKQLKRSAIPQLNPARKLMKKIDNPRQRELAGRCLKKIQKCPEMPADSISDHIKIVIVRSKRKRDKSEKKQAPLLLEWSWISLTDWLTDYGFIILNKFIVI